MADETRDAKPHRYDAALAADIEGRWQAYWEQEQCFRQPNPGEPGFDGSKPKFYCLDMFPYPSGAGLHVGHPEGYTATDIISRYKRMRGFNVLHPMGWDAFGLPAEQYAIQTGVHPVLTTRKAIDTFRGQLKRFGFAYDWSRELGTIDPGYYRWTQWIFVQIYDAWFDREANRARPIAELVAELESGQRPARINPDAAEHSAAVKGRDFGAFSKVDESARRMIIDSWRLAYVGEQTVNWCPKLGTALANEEVIDGRSERGSFPVIRKPLRQWMFRITAYAERLLRGLDGLDWPDSTRAKQTEWIGRSEGAEVDFELDQALGATSALRVFTTRPDTLFGATYMVVAPEHPLVDVLLAGPLPDTDAQMLASYVSRARNRSDLDRQTTKIKTGVFTGARAINPVNGEHIPIWVADYVLMGYGHGAIMAVPAHDERDWEFATKFELPIVEVVRPLDESAAEACFSGEGRNVNSANAEVSLDGLPTPEAVRVITEWLANKGLGRPHVNYKLRDWIFSRQRYWGEPFPVVFDEQGHHHAVGVASLPVTLPELKDYEPEESEDPRPLLAKAKDWITTTAGEAGVPSLPASARVTRETNTMPGWAGSCWYFVRYCDPHNDERLVGEAAERYWMAEGGVDLYIGGAEHAVLHLLYARYWHMVLHDLGHVTTPEPFRKLFHQGLIVSYAYQRDDKTLVPTDEVKQLGEESFVEKATGKAVAQVVAKMSKSLKNVVNPDDVIRDFGADTFRLYEMYMGPLEVTKPWNTRDILGLFRFLQRAWRLVVDEETGELRVAERSDDSLERLLHRTLAAVTADIEKLSFNTAIARMIELVNAGTQAGALTRDQIRRFGLMLSPFAPHLAEEMWARLGEHGSVALQSWPTWDEAQLRDDTVEIPVQIMGKVRSRIVVQTGLDEKGLEQAALADERIQELLAGKTVRKVIVVPGRLVNIVWGQAPSA